jgi:hypothetical protein
VLSFFVANDRTGNFTEEKHVASSFAAKIRVHFREF